MEIAVATVKQNKDSAVKQRIQDIQMLISWREINLFSCIISLLIC